MRADSSGREEPEHEMESHTADMMHVHHRANTRMERQVLMSPVWTLGGMARPERFELPTPGFVGRCSIQLSYGRVSAEPAPFGRAPAGPILTQRRPAMRRKAPRRLREAR